MAGTPCSSCLCACARFERAPRCFLRERRALMDERRPLPLQQWKCLKHRGPRDAPCHSPPILVTYGPAMLSTPRLLVWVGRSRWGWGGLGRGRCNVIVHVMTETRPPGRRIPLCCPPDAIKCPSGLLRKRKEENNLKLF